MRTRFKSPSGTGILELDDDATVEALLDEIKARTGIRRFIVKYGPPMAMKTLGPSYAHEAARSFGLHGETLTVVPEDSNDTPPESTTGARHLPRDKVGNRPSAQNDSADDMVVPWPEREGTLCKLHQPTSLAPAVANQHQCFESCPATTAASSLRSVERFRNSFPLTIYGA